MRAAGAQSTMRTRCRGRASLTQAAAHPRARDGVKPGPLPASGWRLASGRWIALRRGSASCALRPGAVVGMTPHKGFGPGRGVGSGWLVGLPRDRLGQITLCSQTFGCARRGFANGPSECRRRPPAAALSPVLAKRAAGARSLWWTRSRGEAWLTAPAAHPGAGQGSNPDQSRPRVDAAASEGRLGDINPRLNLERPATGISRGNDPAQRLRARPRRGVELVGRVTKRSALPDNSISARCSVTPARKATRSPLQPGWTTCLVAARWRPAAGGVHDRRESRGSPGRRSAPVGMRWRQRGVHMATA